MRISGNIVTLVLLTTICQGLYSQRPSKVKNLDITVRENRAVIHYDIKTRNPGSNHLVHLEFLDEDYNLITPTLLSGDIGPGIPTGPGRSIEWDITNDMQLLGSRVTPVLFLDGTSRQFSKTGGPRNALLSILIPGLGDYFVADRRLMKIKPLMRTVSSLGLIGLGVYVGNQRYHAEGTWERVIKVDSWRFTGDDRFTQKYYEGDIQYYWFKGDKELLISLGAAIWAADVLWVLAKGTNNVKFMRASTRGSDFKLGYQPGGACLQYSFTF